VTVGAELETTIARTTSAVFTELEAVERYPEWLSSSGVRSIERIDDGPIGEGSRLRIEQRISGQAATLDGVVTAFRRDEHLAIRASDPRGVTVELDAALAPDGATTRLRWSIRLSLPLRFRFFESMVASELRRAATADLENLRLRLEAVAGQ
jgi:carbon monoxide dehydrogenase subunit G